MPQIVPVQPVANQTLSIQLNNQATQLNISTFADGLYMQVLLNGTAIVGYVICENQNRIIRNAYLGYLGDFIFADTQGDTPPVYTGLGSRYTLTYLFPADIEASNG